MKIIILGSKGMLGQMAEKYFSQNFEVVSINDRYTTFDRTSLLNKIRESGPGYIINCIGRIVQKSIDPNELYFINTILPLDLHENLLDSQVLIQPSTDCVFNGKANNKYKKNDKANADDDYGWSKRLGELSLENKEKAYIIRVSIIGVDYIDPNPKGLLGWFLSHKNGAEIDGYVDHYWNGITTLEWCKKVEEVIIQPNYIKLDRSNIIQLGTNEVNSKYHLLKLFAKIFNQTIKINKFNTNRSIYKCLEPDIVSKDIEQQLLELKMFTNYFK